MELFVKLFKWYVCVTLFIVGCAFLAATNSLESIKPFFVTILSFGMLYWLSKSFFGMERKLLLVNCLVLIVAAAIPFFYYLRFDFLANWAGYDYFVEWLLWSYACGTPAMGYAFKKFD